MKKVKVLFSVLILTLSLSLFISPPVFTQESITITTYYPAPHGIFSVLRLVPRDTEPANPGEGDIYYDNNTDSLRYWNGVEWVTIGAPVISGVGHAIMMWSGPSNQLPNGWVLCDGQTYTDSNGNPVTTPDLRERFIVGAGGNNPANIGPLGGYSTGDNGDADQITNADQLAAHTHSLGSAGGASDGGSGHTHDYITTQDKTGVTGSAGITGSSKKVADDKFKEYTTTSGSGGHSHSGLTGKTNSAGSGNTSSTVGGSAYYNSRPPYYALCFIMKL